MSTDIILYNTLKKETRSLIGLFSSQLSSKQAFNTVPVCVGTVLNMDLMPILDQKQTWDFIGHPVTPVIPIRNSNNNSVDSHRFITADYEPLSKYIYFGINDALVRVHESNISNMDQVELVAYLPLDGSTTLNAQSIKCISPTKIFITSQTYSSPSKAKWMVYDLTTNTFESSEQAYSAWMTSYLTATVTVFKDKVFIAGQHSETSRHAVVSYNISPFTQINVIASTITAGKIVLFNPMVTTVGEKIFLSGFTTETSSATYDIYSSTDGTIFTREISIPTGMVEKAANTSNTPTSVLVIGKSIIFGFYSKLVEYNTITQQLSIIVDLNMFMYGNSTHVRILGYLHKEQKLLLTECSYSNDDLIANKFSDLQSLDCKVSGDILLFGKHRQVYQTNKFSHGGIFQTSNGTIVKLNYGTRTLLITRPRRISVTPESVSHNNLQIEQRIIME